MDGFHTFLDDLTFVTEEKIQLLLIIIADGFSKLKAYKGDPERTFYPPTI